MYRILFCILSLFALLLSIGFNVRGQVNSKTIQIAHRGAAALAPENTFAAFDKAIELGVDYIELDIQMSKDNKIIVMHDLTVDRTTNGNGYVRDLTLLQLRKLDAGSWFGNEFKNNKIPTLEEVLLKYNDQVLFIIDIKYPEKYPGIENQLIKILKKYNDDQDLSNRIMIQSLSIPMIKELHSSLPNLSTGIIFNKFPSIYQLYSLKDTVNFINVQRNYLTHSIIKISHHFDLKVFAWTVNNQNMANELMLLGIDGLVSDYPQIKVAENKK